MAKTEGPTSDQAIAERMHAAYEAHAPECGYETRPESRVSWHELAGNHRRLMEAAVAEAVLPLRERIAELEPYRLACRKIHQWIGCEDQEVDEAVVRRVEGDARKIAALEAREAELVGALTALHQSVVDWNAAVESVIGRKPYDPMQDAMKLAGEVLAKGRKEVGDE
jgi:hypothetical protein